MTDAPLRLTVADLDATYAFGGPAHDTLVGLVRRGAGAGQEALDRAVAGSPVAALLRFIDGASESLQGLGPEALLAAGTGALLDGADPERAIPALREAVRTGAQSPVVQQSAARLLELAYLRAGEPAEAARLLEEHTPEGLAPVELRRVECLRRAEDQRAIQGYSALLMEGPDPYALACLEEIYEDQADVAALAALHTEAARRETDPAVRALHRYRLGEVLQALGRDDEAAEAFARSEDGGDIGALARSRRLRVLRSGGDPQAYARSLRDQADALGDTARARALIVMAGRVALERGEVGAAVGWLQQARQGRGRPDGRAGELLAEALLAVGDMAGLAALHEGPVAALLARTPYPGAVPPACSLVAADAAGDRLGVSLSCRAWGDELAEGPLAAALMTAAAYFAPSDAAARDHLASAASADPGFVPARIAQVRTAAAAGRRREVLVAASAAAGVVSDPERRAALLLEGAAAADALGEDDLADDLRSEAGEDVAEARSGPPPSREYKGDPKDEEAAVRADEQLQWALAESDDEAAAAALLEAAESFLAAGNEEAALRAWTRAVERDSGVVPALLALAEDADRRASWADAAELYERAWAAIGRDGAEEAVRSLIALERLYEDLGRQDERRGVLTRLFEVSEGDARRRWRRILADLHVKAGEPRTATRVMTEALHDEPLSPSALRRLVGMASLAGEADVEALALETLARNLDDSAERSRLYLRAALLYRDELGGGGVVLENAMLAFMCDNDHRVAFELLEQLYTDEARWREVLGIYDLALSRARQGGPYRAADLLRARGLLEAGRLDRPEAAVESLLCALQEDPADDRISEALEALVTVTNDLDSRVKMLELRAGALPGQDRGAVLAMAAAVCAEGGLHERAVGLLRRARALETDEDQTANALRKSLGALEDWAGLAELELELADRAASPESSAARLADAASALEQAGDLRRAIAALERASDATPADPGLLDELERLCDRTHSWDRLLEVHARKLEMTESPQERARIHFRIGSLHELALADDEAASQSYGRSLEEDPACVPALHGLREIQLRRQDWDGAVHALQREVAAWQAADRKAELWTRIADIRQGAQGDRDGAAQAWREALLEMEGHLPALRGLVPVLMEQRRWDEAARYAELWVVREAAAGDDEGRVRALTARALADLSLGGVRRAAGALIEALSLDPQSQAARDALGQLVERPEAGSLPRQILSELERVAREAGDDRDLAWALLLRGRAAEANGLPDDALDLYREALTLAPAADGPRRALADGLKARRRWGEMCEVLVGAADAGAAGWIKCLCDAAEVRLDRLRDPAGAASLYDRAAHALGPTGDTGVTDAPVERDTTERDSMVRRALFGHAVAARAAKDGRTAIRQLLRLIELETTRRVSEHGSHSLARYHRYLGLVFADEGDAEASERSLRAAVQEAPGDPECVIALAKLLRPDDLAEAEAVLAEGARQAEPAAAVRLDRARARSMAASGRPEAALALLDQSVLAAEDPIPTWCTIAEIEHSAFEDGARRAEARYLGMLDKDLLRREPWRGLVCLHESEADADRLFVTQALGSMLAPSRRTDERLAVPGHEARQRAERPAPLTDTVLEDHVLHRWATDPLWNLWPAAASHLRLTYPSAPEPPVGARALDLVDPGRRDDPIATTVGVVGRLVGAAEGLEVWVIPADRSIRAWPGSPPRLFIGDAWASDVDLAALRFHVARELALLGGDRAHAAGSPAVAAPAARLVAALFNEVAGLPLHENAGAPPDLPRRLVDRARERLAGHPRWAETTPDPDAFLEGVRRTAHRIGLLASGDPRIAIDLLREGEHGEHGDLAPVHEVFGDQEAVADLVRWTAGDGAARARRSLGLALGGDPA